MSLQRSSWAWQQKLPPIEKLALLVLADCATPEGVSWPSREIIADECGCTVRKVTAALKALHSAGLITVLGVDGQRVKYRVGPEGEVAA